MMLNRQNELNELTKDTKDLDVTIVVSFSEIDIDAEDKSKIDGKIFFGMIQRFVKRHNLFRKNQWSVLRLDGENSTDLTVKFLVRCSSYYLYKQLSNGFVEEVEYRNLDHQEYFSITSSVRLVGLKISDNGLTNEVKK